MADNIKTAKMWQEAAAETKECLPLEVLERRVEAQQLLGITLEGSVG